MTDKVEDKTAVVEDDVVAITIDGETKPLEVVPEPTAEPAPSGDEPKDPPADKEYDKAVWGDTGNDVGNSVLQLLSDSGMATVEAKALLYDAVKDGDVSKIDLAALTAKVGKASATLIVSGVKTVIAEDKVRTDAVVAAVEGAAGGKDAWGLIKDWALGNVAEEDLNEYRSMIDAGGKQATLAAKALREAYNDDAANVKIGKRIVDGGTKTPPKVDPGLTKRQYGDQLALLARQGKATPEARAALTAARNRGKKAGI